jgi:hypothetical protein
MEHAFMVNFRQEIANAMWEDRQQYYGNNAWFLYFYEPMYLYIYMNLCTFIFVWTYVAEIYYLCCWI